MSTILLLGTLTGLLLAVGWLLAGTLGTLAGLAVALAVNGLAYWYSDRLILRFYRAEPFSDRRIQGMLEKLVRQAKIPLPKLYLVRSPIMNAFATGRSPAHAVVAVTEGLLKLKDEELEGVLAHELSHIKNRDMLVSAMAAVIAGAVSYLAQIGYFSLFRQQEQRNALPLVLVVIFAPLAAFLVRMAISRSREYKADWTGALLTRNPEGLASALRKISLAAKEAPLQGNAATSHLWIVNPFRPDWFTSLFATHPPLEKRIDRLEVVRSGLA